MAQICKCDICGKEMPLEAFSRSIKNYNFCISSYGKIWDVCRNKLIRYAFNEAIEER